MVWERKTAPGIGGVRGKASGSLGKEKRNEEGEVPRFQGALQKEKEQKKTRFTEVLTRGGHKKVEKTPWVGPRKTTSRPPPLVFFAGDRLTGAETGKGGGDFSQNTGFLGKPHQEPKKGGKIVEGFLGVGITQKEGLDEEIPEKKRLQWVVPVSKKGQWWEFLRSTEAKTCKRAKGKNQISFCRRC